MTKELAMSNAQKMPNVVYLHDNPGVPGFIAYAYSDEGHAYALIPEDIDPGDAIVISQAEREREDEQTTESFDLMHARMTVAEQKYAALLEAGRELVSRWIEFERLPGNLTDDEAEALGEVMKSVQVFEALAHQNQPEAR